MSPFTEETGRSKNNTAALPDSSFILENLEKETTIFAMCATMKAIDYINGERYNEFRNKQDQPLP